MPSLICFTLSSNFVIHILFAHVSLSLSENLLRVCCSFSDMRFAAIHVFVFLNFDICDARPLVMIGFFFYEAHKGCLFLDIFFINYICIHLCLV